MLHYLRRKEKGKPEKDIHGAKWCPTCHRTFGRDANAARNMLACAIGYMTTGERPAHLEGAPVHARLAYEKDRGEKERCKKRLAMLAERQDAADDVDMAMEAAHRDHDGDSDSDMGAAHRGYGDHDQDGDVDMA